MTTQDEVNQKLIQKQIDGYIEKYGWEFIEQRGNDLVFKNGKKEMVVELQENNRTRVFEDGKKVPNMYLL